MSSDALAVQTRIGSSFFGATLAAMTTSLLELSTTSGAIRLGDSTMAIAIIFGTQTLERALLMDGLGIVITSLLLCGLLERRSLSFLRMGIDSFWVLITYFAGFVVFSIESREEG